MNNSFKALLFAGLIGIAGTTAFAVAAKDKPEPELSEIFKTKVSLSQAVDLAEQHMKGKAIHAEFEHSRQGWLYEVEVVSQGKVFDVRIDSDKGSVISAEPDSSDEHDHQH